MVHPGIHILRRSMLGIHHLNTRQAQHQYCSHRSLRNSQVKFPYEKVSHNNFKWLKISWTWNVTFFLCFNQKLNAFNSMCWWSFIFRLFQVHVVHVHAQPMVGPTPTMTVCMQCHQNVLTRLEYEATTRTHLMALTCCIFGYGWNVLLLQNNKLKINTNKNHFSLIPCAILPYCMTSCQNGNHYCPNCGSFIGTYTSWMKERSNHTCTHRMQRN